MAEYIEREAAKGCVKEHYDDAIIMALDNIPAADVRPVVRGKWIAEQFVDDGGLLHEILSEHDTLVCPICGYKYLDLFDSPRYNFCPNCGADMREES